MKKALNIIKRAVDEFGYQVEPEMTFASILEECENVILANVDYDCVDECETNKQKNWIHYEDGEGFIYDCTGDFIQVGRDTETIHNTYFSRFQGMFFEIEWYDANEDSYILMDKVLNTEAEVVALIAK